MCGVTVCMLVYSLTAAVTSVQVKVNMLSALACVLQFDQCSHLVMAPELIVS